MKQARALEVKAAIEKKESQAKQLMLRNVQELEMRQAGYLANQLEEELRLREFKRQKEMVLDVRSDKYQEKLELISQKHAQLEEERKAQGDAVVANYHSKLEQMDKRREEDLMCKMMKHEESQLRLEDAMEKKTQLARQDQHRREQMASQLDSQAQRVDTFTTLKDQLLEQRKFRARMKSAGRERGISLKGMTPGPADYYSEQSCLRENPGAKISNARPAPVEGSIDAMVARQRSLPPPGSYDPKMLPSGDYSMGYAQKGPKMSNGKKQSYLVDLQKQASFMPGPGSYDNKGTMLLEHATAMRRDYMQVPEGRAASWAIGGEQSGPGPAAYVVDKYSRQKRIRSQKSLPTLSKAMNLI